MITNSIVRATDISHMSTMHLPSIADYFVHITNPDAIPDIAAYAHKRNLRILPIGGGSNTVFAPRISGMILMHIDIRGIVHEGNRISVSAGEQWDHLVEKAVSKKLSGIEALSGIPGTVGASPVQNIGAYGQEVRDTIALVSGYDTKANKPFRFENSDCAFEYRNSIFKQYPNRFIITETIFELSDQNPDIPSYPALQKEFENKPNPALSDIRNAVLRIRSEKLPNIDTLPNVGSFFKNPIISKNAFETIQKTYPNTPHFPVDDTRVKIPAGWLIEQCGHKGVIKNGVGMHEKNALVMVNHGSGTYDAIVELMRKIQDDARKTFAIDLEPEVNIIS